MRKLIISMNVSLDGFMAGSNCELDWHFDYWNQEMAGALSAQLAESDTILLGRVTYNAMARYWPSKAIGRCCTGEDLVFAHMMNNYQKFVFSSTLEKADWYNSRVVKGDILGETARLKQQPGKNITVYGSGKIVSALMSSDLVDEYRLWVHPVLLGKGRYLFRGLQEKIRLKLITVTAFDSGVAVLYYRTDRE